MLEKIVSSLQGSSSSIRELVLQLAVEIAREGREGRRIGTIFTLGDADQVLARSRPLILDPISGHPAHVRNIRNDDLRGTLKELAQLDGAFIFDDEGFLVAGCRYLDARASDIEVSMGLGSRHLAAASISKVTQAIGIVVSESAIVRVYEGGVLVGEVIPELWLLNQHVFSKETQP